LKKQQSAKQKSAKNKPKNKQIFIKTSPRQANCKFSKKNKFVGKPQG